MTPITSVVRIKGRPLDVFLSETQIADCVQDAITGGGQVVALRKSGSATIAPAHSSLEVLDHIRGARSGAVPVSVMLEGEFGIDNVVLGVPAFLGQSGFLGVQDLSLTADETRMLQDAAAAIRARLGLT